MTSYRLKYIFIPLLAISVLCAQEMPELSGKFTPLRDNEYLIASKHIIKGESNYTLLISRKSERDSAVIVSKKNIIGYWIRNNAKEIFFQEATHDKTFPKLYLCNGVEGHIILLGSMPDFDISTDGKFLLTYKSRQDDQVVGSGILYSLPEMKQITYYDFDALLRIKYSMSKVNFFFDLGFLFNSEIGGFEILFDQYGEIGPKTCTGFISIHDYKFKFTNQKEELLKKMGY